jgi:nucleotide-binding universal stress UspA family protein
MFKRILLAVDGSEHAQRAAKLAGELARQMGSDVRVVIAFDPLPGYLGEPMLQAALSQRMKEADKILQRALDEVGKVPGELKTEILEGPPAEAILEVERTRNNDLIVMGTRGRGRLGGLLLGSQSQKVVAHANCPVLLVR